MPLYVDDLSSRSPGSDPYFVATLVSTLFAILFGGILAGAMMFTGLEPVTPSEQAKEEVLQLFRTGEAPPEYRQKMETLVDRARHIPKENLPVIRSRAVAARCRAARPGAEPGPSQVRVTHLKAELLVDGGAEILTAWARLWQRAEESHVSREMG